MFTAKPFSWSQTEKTQWLRLDFGLRQTLDSSAVQPGVSFVTTLSCCFLMDEMGINCNHLTELLGRVSEMAQAGCSARDPAHIICQMNKCWPLLSGLGEPLLPLHGTIMALLTPDLSGSAAAGCLRPRPGHGGGRDNGGMMGGSCGEGCSSWSLLRTHASHTGRGTGLKRDYNPWAAGLLFCVNGEIRFPAFQILLVLFVELKPICLLLLTFELRLAPGFSMP